MFLPKPNGQASNSRKAHVELWYHINTLYLFTCNDIQELVCMPFLFAIISSFASPAFHTPTTITFHTILLKTPLLIFWNWTNLLLFNIHNQRQPKSVISDSIGKPWRPIPTGRITSAQSRNMLFALYPLLFCTFLATGGWRPFLAQALWCLWYNEWGGAKGPFQRNLLNALGIVTCMSGPLELLLPSSRATTVIEWLHTSQNLAQYPEYIMWLVIIALVIITTNQLQDFRDQDNDCLEGRTTIPLALGDTPARWITAGILVAWSVGLPAFWGVGRTGYIPTVGVGSMLCVNLLADRTAKGDRRVWKMWAPWMLTFFTLPLIKSGMR